MVSIEAMFAGRFFPSLPQVVPKHLLSLYPNLLKNVVEFSSVETFKPLVSLWYKHQFSNAWLLELIIYCYAVPIILVEHIYFNF